MVVTPTFLDSILLICKEVVVLWICLVVVMFLISAILDSFCESGGNCVEMSNLRVDPFLSFEIGVAVIDSSSSLSESSVSAVPVSSCSVDPMLYVNW